MDHNVQNRELTNAELDNVMGGDTPFHGMDYSANESARIEEWTVLATIAEIGKGLGRAFGA